MDFNVALMMASLRPDVAYRFKVLQNEERMDDTLAYETDTVEVSQQDNPEEEEPDGVEPKEPEGVEPEEPEGVEPKEEEPAACIGQKRKLEDKVSYAMERCRFLP